MHDCEWGLGARSKVEVFLMKVCYFHNDQSAITEGEKAAKCVGQYELMTINPFQVYNID